MGLGTVFVLLASQTPTLCISQSGQTVTVFWQNVSGWTLQQNNNLTLPGGWSANSGVDDFQWHELSEYHIARSQYVLSIE